MQPRRLKCKGQRISLRGYFILVFKNTLRQTRSFVWFRQSDEIQLGQVFNDADDSRSELIMLVPNFENINFTCRNISKMVITK